MLLCSIRDAVLLQLRCRSTAGKAGEIVNCSTAHATGQRTYFGVKVRQCRKPFVPNYFGIILNYLVSFQIFWYHTKEITQGALNLTNWVRLHSNQTSHCCIFICMCTFFLTPRTLADSVRLISRAQHLGCKPDDTCRLKCGVV